jgi:TPR repeat protein
MRRWQHWIWSNIIHVAGRPFAKGAFIPSVNPFCNADRSSKTREENNEDLMKRVEANDPGAIYFLANSYQHGFNGLQQDQTKAKELYTRAAGLGYIMAHNQLGGIYDEGGNLKKAKFHLEAAAMAGYDVARYNIGCMESYSGNMERAIKHFTIAASGGEFCAMDQLSILFEKGAVSIESIDSTLAAYNKSCAKMRSEARDACIQIMAEASAQPQL